MANEAHAFQPRSRPKHDEQLEPVADCRRTNYLVRAIQPDATVRQAADMGAVVELTDEE